MVRGLSILVALFGLCAGPAFAQEVDARAALLASAKAMGADRLKTIEIAGAGSTSLIGQQYSVEGNWPQVEVANYTRAIQAQLKHGDKNQATQTYQAALDLLEKNKAPADGVRRFRAELEPLLNLTQMSRDNQEALSSPAPPPEAEAAGSH